MVAMKPSWKTETEKALCFADDGTHIIQTCENIMSKLYKKDSGGSMDEDINNAFLDQLSDHLLKGGSAPTTDLPEQCSSFDMNNKGCKSAIVAALDRCIRHDVCSSQRCRNPPGADIKWKSRPQKGEENCPKTCFKMKGRKALYHRVARCEELRNIVHPPRESQWADLDVSMDPATCGDGDARCLLTAHQQLKLCQSHNPCSEYKYENGEWMNIQDALNKGAPQQCYTNDKVHKIQLCDQKMNVVEQMYIAMKKKSGDNRF